MKNYPARICLYVIPILCCVSLETRAQEAATTTSTPAAESTSNYLVSADDLAAKVSDFQILDTRRPDQFAAGHIPGSRNLSSGDWMRTSMKNVRDRGYWEAQLQALGISSQTPIVIVGDSPPTSARIWWLLKYFGLKDVRILDGGYGLWEKRKLPISTDVAAIGTSTFKVEFQEDRLAELKDVEQFLANQSCQIVDSRSEAEFAGRRGVGARTGHIPGAVHFEWSELLDDQGCYLAPDAMKQLLAKKGIDLTKPLAAHCQTGGRSAVSVFAFEMLGAKDVKNYYKGWSEYSQALTAPVEK